MNRNGSIYVDGRHVGTVTSERRSRFRQNKRQAQEAHARFGGGFGGGDTRSTAPRPEPARNFGTGYGGGDATSTTMPRHARAFVRAIGQSETGYDRNEAYTDRYNQPGNNANVRRYGQRGADYGYYQMNAMNVDEAVSRYNMDRDVARHLAGGLGQPSSEQQQTEAVHQYLQRRWPNEYNRLVNQGDYEGMQRATRGTWFGLSRHGGSVARREYDRVLNGD